MTPVSMAQATAERQRGGRSAEGWGWGPGRGWDRSRGRSRSLAANLGGDQEGLTDRCEICKYAGSCLKGLGPKARAVVNKEFVLGFLVFLFWGGGNWEELLGILG